MVGKSDSFAVHCGRFPGKVDISDLPVDEYAIVLFCVVVTKVKKSEFLTTHHPDQPQNGFEMIKDKNLKLM